MIHTEHRFSSRRLAALLPSYGWLLLFFLAPFLLVVAISFSPISESIPPYRMFFGVDENNVSYFAPYYDNYKLLFSDSLYIRAYFDSVRLAAISTVVALCIAYPLAYGIVKQSPKWRNILLLFVIIPFWTSLLIRVYAWITLLKANGLINEWLMALNIIDAPLQMINTEGAVVLGIVYSYLPFMILPLYSALEKIPPSLMEAAEDLGCRPFSAFLQVILPLSIPGIIAGSMLVFIPAVGEFVIPDLLGGAQVLTIGKVLWNEFFMNRDWPTAAAVTIIMTLVVVVPIMLLQRMIGKSKNA